MGGDLSSVLSVQPDGIRLAVKAKPGLSRPRPPRVVAVGDEKYALEVTVSAPPEDGKANVALGKCIAEGLGVKRNAVTLLNGATGRLKLFAVTGNPVALQEKLEAWYSG